VLVENAAPLRETIANLKSFTDALARNSDRIDSIAQGLERMVGGGDKESPTVYDLAAPRDFPKRDKIPDKQVAVAEPSAVLLLDTQKMLVRSAEGVTTALPDARWSDSLPKLLQARIVQSFENANYPRAERDQDGVATDYKLLTDIRTLQLSASPTPLAEVELGAKIVDGDGRIVDARIFRATAPASAVNAPGASAAFNEAFRRVLAELVLWTLRAI
jgi:phospholipid/cholesterol/gamma-HCH transport system substrate-binding protein